MFSGIIEEFATVVAIKKDRDNIDFTLTCSFVNELSIDQSVAHNGVCLTVVSIADGNYVVTAMKETLDRTNLGLLKVGDKVNIERSMLMNGRLDGHIVQGHVDETAQCIAMDDANQYHARHRQVSISQLMPIIEHHYTERVHRQTVLAYVLLAIVLLLLFLGAVALFLLSKRHRAVHAARQLIDEMNRNLTIANHVKEQLLGTLVAGHSQYLGEVEKYQNRIRENVAKRQLNELMTIPKNVDARLQRIVFNRRIDEMLLSIFPSFVDDFNALLKPGFRIEVKQDELLSPALRIFALIRLGIVHNEVIAEILDYSVNTVYTYKTRTINQSPLSPDDFYTALMRIK